MNRKIFFAARKDSSWVFAAERALEEEVRPSIVWKMEKEKFFTLTHKKRYPEAYGILCVGHTEMEGQLIINTRPKGGTFSEQTPYVVPSVQHGLLLEPATPWFAWSLKQL